MPKYRKKPVVIEAFQMTEERRRDNSEWPEWLNKAWQGNIDAPGSVYPKNFSGIGLLVVRTLEGIMTIDFGDFIIQGVQGELYPCKPDIFNETYDLVEE